MEKSRRAVSLSSTSGAQAERGSCEFSGLLTGWPRLWRMGHLGVQGRDHSGEVADNFSASGNAGSSREGLQALYSDARGAVGARMLGRPRCVPQLGAHWGPPCLAAPVSVMSLWAGLRLARRIVDAIDAGSARIAQLIATAQNLDRMEAARNQIRPGGLAEGHSHPRPPVACDPAMASPRANRNRAGSA